MERLEKLAIVIVRYAFSVIKTVEIAIAWPEKGYACMVHLRPLKWITISLKEWLDKVNVRVIVLQPWNIVYRKETPVKRTQNKI